MKRIALATALTAGVLTLSACNQSSADESEVVVETKNGNVTKEEFYQELKDRYGDKLLHEMVVTEVLDDKYEVTEEEVKKEVQKYKDQYGNKFGQALQQMGMKNEKQFENVIEYSLLQEKAATAKVEVTDKEIQQHYDRMKTKIEASHILVKSQEKAQEIMKKLDNGAKFADLAKEYSQDPSGKNGGKLGTFGPGKMVQPFEDAAYSMEVGEISKPVSSQFGIHIIKVTDKIENKDVKPLEEIKGDIKRQLKSKKIDKNKARADIDQLIKDAEVDIKDEAFKDLFKSPEKQTSSSK
ncbi:peptidylprolyl isomerase [Pontibacillus marinus]|uniref:Foldase protein PrsA n=1 Tax=Pontibacillus marinus BH030004 = DSM 16465 TaxID=1385511 RepID=A0A0A5G505_9BACI|nr:peptidylprolyl isomerase [Pontibacillus marinus]KGX86165.1 foldase PrsA [Pontibacillus marinus BH030004 = DSM 16465]